MRPSLAAVLLVYLTACSNLTADQQAKIQEVLKVACNVDGAVVPVAQPIVATLGQSGSAATSTDLLVHPEVVAACSALNGTPASVTQVNQSAIVTGNSSASGTSTPASTAAPPAN